ncbi:MAG: PAS domain S-box protein, partial [Gallionella sp.]|nr:PAS domain S-box protein [Gallionella sp.]
MDTLRTLFTPAISLLNRISYTRKFTLLWLLSLFAIAVVVQELYSNLDRVIQPSQRQLEGLVLLKPISQTIQAIQLHRGTSAALLSGNKSMRDRRAARETEASTALETMEAKLPAHLAADEKYRRIKADWQRLRKDGLDWNVAANFTAHTLLIEQLHTFQIFIADEYWLTLDSEVTTYYLIDTAINKLPHTLEQLGQLRAYGTGILTRRNLSEQQKIKLHNLLAELDTSLLELKANLEKTGRNSPALQGSALAISDDIANSARLITGLVSSDIFTGRFATPSDEFLKLATAEIDKCYAQLYGSLLPGIETLIKARITQAKHSLYSSLGLSFFAFLVVLYFSVSMYYAIIGNIASLTRSARSFAGGNLRERIKLATRDELSRVGDSFNEMADGFNAMLEARKHAEDSLKKESHKNETLLRAASDGIHILDLEGNVVQVNDAFCKMLGYTPQELSVMNAAQWDTKYTAQQIRAKLAELKDDAVMYETRQRRHDGGIIDVEVNIAKVDVGDRQLVYCSSRDVTERKRAEWALIESEGKFQAVIETALDAVVQMDSAGIITGWSSQAEKIFGWSASDTVGRLLHETIIPPQYREAHQQGLKHFLLTGEGPILNKRLEITGLHHDGREFPVELSVASILIAGKHEFSAFIRDITKKKESEDLIWKQANFDMLTGLPNRHMFYDRLAQEIKKAHRAGLKMALLFIDLDKFKEVNDALGHSMGDILLIETARRIGVCVRETDIVARLGGDEFTVVLAELADISSAERVAENILRKMAE